MNTWAIPVVRYTAGIVNWTKAELEAIDSKTRKLMTAFRALHPQSDVDRLYLPRCNGGRGLQQVQQVMEDETWNLAEYVRKSKEPVLMEVHNQKLFSRLESTSENHMSSVMSQ